MSIPDFQSVMRPVLAQVQDGGVALPLGELCERIADEFVLSEGERIERLLWPLGGDQ